MSLAYKFFGGLRRRLSMGRFALLKSCYWLLKASIGVACVLLAFDSRAHALSCGDALVHLGSGSSLVEHVRRDPVRVWQIWSRRLRVYARLHPDTPYDFPVPEQSNELNQMIDTLESQFTVLADQSGPDALEYGKRVLTALQEVKEAGIPYRKFVQACFDYSHAMSLVTEKSLGPLTKSRDVRVRNASRYLKDFKRRKDAGGVQVGAAAGREDQGRDLYAAQFNLVFFPHMTPNSRRPTRFAMMTFEKLEMEDFISASAVPVHYFGLTDGLAEADGAIRDAILFLGHDLFHNIYNGLEKTIPASEYRRKTEALRGLLGEIHALPRRSVLRKSILVVLFELIHEVGHPGIRQLKNISSFQLGPAAEIRYGDWPSALTDENIETAKAWLLKSAHLPKITRSGRQ